VIYLAYITEVEDFWPVFGWSFVLMALVSVDDGWDGFYCWVKIGY
jgi:hypothetical protein